MKKHPLFYGIVIFSAAGLILFGAVFALTRLIQEGAILRPSNNIGVVNIEGVITESRYIVENIDAFRRDDSIRAIVVRIDSPGGGVAASQEIYQAIINAREDKKVVASLGAVAASGGYLIASAANQIVANPGTITGSISAMINVPNIEGLLKKLGIGSTVVKSGKFKDMGSPTRKMSPEERAIMQRVVDDIFEQFIDAVAKHRNMTRKELLPLADGRIFTGKYAYTAGLVDHLGDFTSAVRLAAHLSGMEVEPNLVHSRKPRSWLDRFIRNQAPFGEILDKFIHPRVYYLYF